MRIALLADTFPPLRTSGAIQLRDLSLEFVRQGHSVTVLVASPNASLSCQIELIDGVQVVRLRSPKTKDVSYVRRTISEFMMPYVMAYNFIKSPLTNERWDGIVWYSPSIFLGPFAKRLKNASNCKGYLIIRDIFPEWAVDMGLMRKGLAYKFFKWIANNQYSVADIIGVQTSGNLKYFEKAFDKLQNQRVEILHNWLACEENCGCSIDIAKTHLAGRKIFVYAGNMGIAQGMDQIFGLVERLKENSNVGFLFVGRGSDAQHLRNRALNLRLNNCLFFDEIDPSEIPGLYAQCHVGIVSLDHRHKTHNIPGKFLSYMVYGLPVLANINAGNDLVEIINCTNVGRVSTVLSLDALVNMTIELAEAISSDPGFDLRCKELAERLFTPKNAVKQIISALQDVGT